jgi:uncharacterized MAPEG superfamily protein
MTSMTALLGFTAWTLFLVLVVFSYRGLRLLQGAPINNWPRGKADTGDAAFAKRASDAHANCLENLSIFAVLVLAAAALGKDAAVATYAPLVLYARFGQSAAHLLGTTKPLVLVRATFWAAQLVLFGLMFKGLLA